MSFDEAASLSEASAGPDLTGTEDTDPEDTDAEGVDPEKMKVEDAGLVSDIALITLLDDLIAKGKDDLIAKGKGKQDEASPLQRAVDLSTEYVDALLPLRRVKKTTTTGVSSEGVSYETLYARSKVMTALFFDRHATVMFAIRDLTQSERASRFTLWLLEQTHRRWQYDELEDDLKVVEVLSTACTRRLAAIAKIIKSSPATLERLKIVYDPVEAANSIEDNLEIVDSEAPPHVETAQAVEAAPHIGTTHTVEAVDIETAQAVESIDSEAAPHVETAQAVEAADIETAQADAADVAATQASNAAAATQAVEAAAAKKSAKKRAKRLAQAQKKAARRFASCPTLSTFFASSKPGSSSTPAAEKGCSPGVEEEVVAALGAVATHEPSATRKTVDDSGRRLSSR